MKYTPENVGLYGGYLLIFLDDKLLNIDRIMSVDDIRGRVKYILVNKKGEWYLDRETEEPAFVVLTGKVDVLIAPNAPEEVHQYFKKLAKEQS